MIEREGLVSRLNPVLLLAVVYLGLQVAGGGMLLASEKQPFGYHATISSPITPVTAGYLRRVIERAESKGADRLLLELDTPGGLMRSTREITGAIMNADIPVIVWVGPGGARAASAGVFITYAGHVAAMAPGTNIGAAHPVKAGGGDLKGDMKKKVVNDAVKQLQSYAEVRGRNASIAEKLVRESMSLTAEEAAEKNVVDFIAESPEAVWRQLEQRSVRVQERTIKLEGTAEQRRMPMTWQEQFLNTLVNPDLVYLFMVVAVLGLITEFSNPGIGIGGITSAVGFLLALYGLSILPVNWVGFGLLVLGMALMLSDLVVPSFGLLTIGGLSCFFVGSTMLFQHSFTVSLPLIVLMTGVAGGVLLLLGTLIFFGQLRSVRIGNGVLEGKEGTVRQELNPEGMVYVNGEYWTAEASGTEAVTEGETIRVVREEGQKLVVEPINSSRSSTDSQETRS